MPGMHLVRGRQAILEKQPMLAELCRRTGQPGAMDWLEYDIDSPTAIKKIPTLLLFGLPGESVPEDATANDLLGAVLLYEYRAAGRATNVFATDDATGQHGVIAPEHLRARIVETACRCLIERGAVAVLITFNPVQALGTSGLHAGSNRRYKLGQRLRRVPLGLHFAATVDETFSCLGKHTRRNLRYYRRRLESELGAEFVPQAKITQEEFLRINRASMNPVSEDLARWRYDAISRFPGTVFQGLRDRDGGWLSLIGGRRNGPVVVIDWQVNLDGLPRYSLSTGMRAFVIEHEVEQGTTSLLFCGGTPHPMRHSFFSVNAVDVVALRRSPAAWMLRRMAHRILPETNFLRDVLSDRDLAWS